MSNDRALEFHRAQIGRARADAADVPHDVGSGLWRPLGARFETPALSKLKFPRNSLPEWVREDFSEDQLFWFATAMTAFYDQGI